MSQGTKVCALFLKEVEIYTTELKKRVLPDEQRGPESTSRGREAQQKLFVSSSVAGKGKASLGAKRSRLNYGLGQKQEGGGGFEKRPISKKQHPSKKQIGKTSLLGVGEKGEQINFSKLGR